MTTPRNPVVTRIRGLAAAVLVVLAAAALAACGGSGGSGGQSIILYNGQHVQTAQNLVAAFEAATGISVSIRSDDEDTLADQIVTEGSHSPADVFLTENSPPLESLQAKGLLAKVDAATLSHTPARFNSPSGDWVGVSARVSVLIYNPALISASQLPTKVSQLADPQYRGKLAIAPQETDFQPIVTSYLRAYGRAATLSWLKGIQANAGGHVYPDNETIASQVNRGAVAFGIVNQYYWWRMRAEIGVSSTHSKIAYFAPGDPGYVIDVSGAAVLKSSAHQAAAQKFLAFLISAAGQRIIAQSDSFEYPLRPGVAANSQLPPLSSLHPDPADTIAKLGDGSTALQLLQQAQLG
jgi:iron(III) transport system substrate-binding protein